MVMAEVSDIGRSMASTSGWTSSSEAGSVGNNQSTNNSGCNAVPGGHQHDDGRFNLLRHSTNFRSSTENGSSTAWEWNLLSHNDEVYRDAYDRRYGFFVRCIKN